MDQNKIDYRKLDPDELYLAGIDEERIEHEEIWDCTGTTVVEYEPIKIKYLSKGKLVAEYPLVR